ncbi:MAG: 50S ribosomal protein L4 [Saprospiraceae bacterium]|nr:50S ribosomal protein L4 [Saprospiraceae bacterium]MBK8110021.1 50S ribosomal protein L4 [Saprospiraceae bacterium]MBK8850550.1 50S ribosomal protein L4 [Saprospiraceae bacterium]MBL0080976.1 50S ribosomal protein L4 [Saprospiraceae bacterium]
MRIDVLNSNGQSTGRSIELPDAIFGIEPNEHAMYLAVKQFNAAQRQGTHKSKEKWEIARTTKKFKRQKGTGGARAGSLKSPTVRGGGRAFGPRPRDYDFSLNKKVRKLARYSALSLKAQNGKLKVVEDLNYDAPKTKTFAGVMKGLGVNDVKSALIVLPDYNENVYLSGRNIENARLMNVKDINTFEVLNATDMVLFESAVAKFV